MPGSTIATDQAAIKCVQEAAGKSAFICAPAAHHYFDTVSRVVMSRTAGSVPLRDLQLTRGKNLNHHTSAKPAPRARLRLIPALLCAAFGYAGNACAIDVANQADWNTAVAAVAAAGASSTVSINFTAGFTLTSSMSALKANSAGVTVNITGNGNTVDGNALFQGITVMGNNALAVNISNLTLNNTLAKGGNGGGGADGGGGGGLGAGGGLFVASGANVTLQDVAFSNNKAQGGNGGTAGANSGGAGGGGLNGGNGTTPPSGSGQGGAGSAGGSGTNYPGSGGAAGTPGGTGGAANGGTGGSGATGGGGGGGGAATGGRNGGNGGAGGFGGGGGGGGFWGGLGSNFGSGGAGGYGAGAGGVGNNGQGGGGAGYGGAVFVMNGGTLTIKTSGTLSYSGNSTVSGINGTPVASLGQDIFINGANQTVTMQVDSGSATFAGSTQTTQGSIAGEGGITKTGAGNLILTGTNRYTGTTNINAGTLSVNGSLASPVSVNNGGTLGGTGTINNAVTVQSGGVFAPGNSIGTITVNGSVNFSSGSTYRVEIDALGNADRINVTGAPGTAQLSGGRVDVQAGTGTYQNGMRYTILNATGGVNGSFSQVTSNFAFLTPFLTYDPNNVYLNLARNDTTFGAVASTPNQYAVGTGFQYAAAGGNRDMGTVISTLIGLSPAQARTAYDTAGGETLVEMQRASAAFANGFTDRISRRIGIGAIGDVNSQMAAFTAPLRLAANEVFSDVAPLYAQSAGSTPYAGTAGPRDTRGFWLVGYGDAQKTNGDGNAFGSKLRGGGISAGLDVELGNNSLVGVALSSGASRLTFDSLSDTGRSRGNAFGVYGIHSAGPWSFKGIAAYSESQNHLDRAIVIGPLSRSASADFRSRNYSLYAEAAYDLKRSGFTLQPVAALSYLGTRTGTYTETGAGSLSLTVNGQDTDSTRSLLGARTIHEFEKFKLKLQALWAHEFGNVNTPITAAFSGAPAATFQVNGVKLKRDSLVLGVDASGEIRKNLHLLVSAQAEGRSGQVGFAVFGGVRKVF
jgi:outer membrane autotransporter protein